MFWAQVFEATAALQLQCRLRVVIATNILVCFHHFSFMWSACHASFDQLFPTETLQIHLLQPACCKVSRAHSPQQIALNLITGILTVVLHVRLIAGNAGRKPSQLCDCKFLLRGTVRRRSGANVSEFPRSFQCKLSFGHRCW